MHKVIFWYSFILFLTLPLLPVFTLFQLYLSSVHFHSMLYFSSQLIFGLSYCLIMIFLLSTYAVNLSINLLIISLNFIAYSSVFTLFHFYLFHYFISLYFFHNYIMWRIFEKEFFIYLKILILEMFMLHNNLFFIFIPVGFCFKNLLLNSFNFSHITRCIFLNCLMIVNHKSVLFVMPGY